MSNISPQIVQFFTYKKNWGNTPKSLCGAFTSNNLLKLVIRTWKLQNIISVFWTLKLFFYCIVSILYRSMDGKPPNLLFFNSITFQILCQLCPVVDISLYVSVAAYVGSYHRFSSSEICLWCQFSPMLNTPWWTSGKFLFFQIRPLPEVDCSDWLLFLISYLHYPPIKDR